MQKNAVIKKSFKRSTDVTHSSQMLFAASLLHVFIVTFENRAFLSKPFEFYVLKVFCVPNFALESQDKTLRHKIPIHIARSQYHWNQTYMN